MDAKELEIKLRKIDIKYLEGIIKKMFLEHYDNLTEQEVKRIYNIVNDKEEE